MTAPLPGPAPAARPGPPATGTGETAPSVVAASDTSGDGVRAGTGHPAVDGVLQALANAAPLSPADQIAEYEAAHRVLQETLASIDRA